MLLFLARSGPGRACYAGAMESAQKSEPPPEFKKMNTLMRRIVKVPKGGVGSPYRKGEKAATGRQASHTIATGTG